MGEIAIYAVVLVATFLGGIWLGRRLMRRIGQPKVDTCTDGYCHAFAWDYCTAGRCKYHCRIYCECATGEDALKAIARAKR